MLSDLPIHAVLPGLLAALREGAGAVLVAPPGAGKTTSVAPALIGEGWCGGQVILTSPRRVAARAAAERMSEMLGEKPGETVGYVTRLDSRTSARTRVLVMTEAIFVNRILDDPELGGVSAVLFDEAHERNLDSDLGLALALETRGVLREDLRVLVMSATIDGARFAGLLGPGTPVVESEGRAHPLRIEWLGSRPDQRIDEAVAVTVRTVWRQETGDILAFLPGVGEIERVRERLESGLPEALVLPLHGQVEPQAQRAAIRRDPEGRRRIVLATAIAETSLTLDGVSVVVDSGLSRRAEYDRAAGTTHLVTERASQAAAAQRAGRAARQGPGVAYRLWEEGGHRGRPPYDPPEIAIADLSPLVLKAAQWGSPPEQLPFLDAPPEASLAAARGRLGSLGALDPDGRLTAAGEELSQLPLDPRGAAMVLFGARHGAGERAARLALLLQERKLGGTSEDLGTRLDRWNADRSPRAQASRRLAQGWADKAARLVGGEKGRAEDPPLAAILAAGSAEFVAMRRDTGGETWLSGGGRGYVLDPASPLARSEFLVIGDAQGMARGARITAAAAMTREEVEFWLVEAIESRSLVEWRDDRAVARRERRLGAVKLTRVPDPEPDPQALADLLREKALERLEALLPADLLARARFAGIEGLSTERLEADAGLWLEPLLHGRRDLAIPRSSLVDSLLGLLDWDTRQRLDTRAPRHFASPAGTTHRIDYTADDAPSVEVRVQALFGLDRHPLVGDTPLLLKLTSPAGRPVQATRDLPGFWRGSWADVAKDMKGRYPKHRWPAEPWAEKPSLKTRNAFQNSGG
ncbi:ATP-dependent helicase HrpB [Qipengyuania sp. MTN3-11]|uniref:ATP-dependent helicase HrpB n=1 Tax=Qipengyuania sp. MTN3-11 TaxID=3056557 RepID=UPI0036F4093B